MPLERRRVGAPGGRWSDYKAQASLAAPLPKVANVIVASGSLSTVGVATTGRGGGGGGGGETPASVVVAAPGRGADTTSDGVGATMRGRSRWRGGLLAVTGDALGLSEEE